MLFNDKASKEVTPVVTNTDLDIKSLERSILESIREVERYKNETETSSNEATIIGEEAKSLKENGIDIQERLSEESELSETLEEAKTAALDTIESKNNEIEIYEREISEEVQKSK